MLSSEKSKPKKKVLRKPSSSKSSKIMEALGAPTHYYEALRASTSSRESASSSLSPRQEWWIIFAVRFLAYAIPLSFLLYVLYYNYLPFGYDKTFVINVGEPGDTDSSREFYLEPSRGLSDATSTVAPDGATSTYRTLNGLAYAVFRPKAVLDGANVTVSVEGDGASLIPPQLDFNPASTTWDYSWDFSTSTPADFINSSTTNSNTAFHFEDGAYFDGKSKLELASSSDMFEDGPFSVYAEWTPQDPDHNAQQIVGHYNWEIWQNRNNVQFQLGRTSSSTGNIYVIKHGIDSSFYNKKHTIHVIYDPGESGYVYMYIDNTLSGYKAIGTDFILKSYGDENLTFGWTPHNYGKNPYFKGVLHKFAFINRTLFDPKTFMSGEIKNDSTYTAVIKSSSQIKQIKLHAEKF